MKFHHIINDTIDSRTCLISTVNYCVCKWGNVTYIYRCWDTWLGYIKVSCLVIYIYIPTTQTYKSGNNNYNKNLQLQKVSCITIRSGGRIDEWVRRKDEFLSGRASSHGWMEAGWGMDGWMERGHCQPTLELCVLWPPHLLLAPILCALPCLVSRIGVHADWLKNPIAKANSKDFSCGYE